MVTIIDNKTRKLSDYVREHLKKSKEAKFAIGYFFLSGWNTIKEGIPQDPQDNFLRIVIGDETIGATVKELSRAYKLKLKSQLLEHISEFKNIEKLTELYKLINDNKLNIRIYDKGKLHAKLYLFLEHPEELSNPLGGSPGVAIVGSSNLTRAGLTENKELNVLFTDREAIMELNKWFDELWEESEEFREELMKIIEIAQKEGIELGKLVTPRELFKFLVWKWFDGRIEPIEKKDILAEFQLIGVINAIDIINKHNGVIVADSVGLGKSFIGASLIEEYILGKLPQWDPNNYGIKKERKALLILPPSLIPQWEHLLFYSGYFFSGNVYSKPLSTKTERYKVYEIYQKVEGGIVKIGEVGLMSLGIFSSLDERDIRDLGLNYEYDLILIDEAHKFRNRQTKRWKNARVLRFKDDDKTFQNKFILLTATPLNNTIWDIYNLIKLFSDDLFSTFKGRGVNVTQLFQEFKELKKKWKENPKYEPELRKKAQEIKEKVLDEVMILRTRRYIKETFGKGDKIKVGDKELSFKEPEPEKVFYTEVPVYKEYEELIQDIGKHFEALEFAYTKVYTSGYVVIGNSSSSLFEEKPEEIEEEFIRVPLNTILKLLIAKRLESSVFAFEKTLDKMYKKNNQFYAVLRKLANKVDKLSFEQLVEELNKVGDELLKIAGKDEIQEILEEDDVSTEEYHYSPKLRMLLNFLSKGFGEDFESSKLPIPKFRNETEFFDYLRTKSGLVYKLKIGIKRTVDELKRDKEIMETIKIKLDKIKFKDSVGNPLTVGEITEEDGKYPIYVYKDPKLEKLKKLIYDDLRGMKYIIFTQYKDTAKYLYYNLIEWLKEQGSTLTYIFDTKKGGLKVGLVTGELTVEEKERMIKRFAPEANGGWELVDKYGEIMILISTDSLSEGVNLQDADGVVNYDLPWNPMIIVQRVGRVNRIGSTKDIFVKNFVPVQEIEVSLGLLAKLQEKIKDITLLVGKEFYILSSEEEISIETFGERLKSLAELKLSQLEETSMSEDFRFIKGGIPDEVLAEFELLDFIQNKLGLKKEDFEDIKHLISSTKPVYAIIGENKLISVFEIYRGKKRVGKKVVIFEDGQIMESTCREFIKLWNLQEVPEMDINFGELASLIKEVNERFREEVLPRHRPTLKQKGFVKNLYNYLRNLEKQKQLVQTIEKEELRKAKTYLAWAELNTQEIKEFKEYLLSIGALKIKGKLLDVVDPSLLVKGILEYFRAGDIDKKLSYKLIGWWY